MPLNTHPPLFFEKSQAVNDELGRMFTFINASYVGMRELWWQVRGYSAEYQGVTAADLNSKFLGGLPPPGGALDLKGACVSTPWDAHDRQYARWVLFDSCMFFEGWLEEVCGSVFNSQTKRKDVIKSMQFPTTIGKNGKQQGLAAAVADVNAVASAPMKLHFFPTVSSHPLNCWASVETWLTAYKYFKQCRNAIAHSGGRVTQAIVDAHADLLPLNTAANFRKPFELELAAPSLGAEVPLSFRNSVLLAMAVRRLIITLDATLCTTIGAEQNFKARLAAGRRTGSKFMSLPLDQTKLERRVDRLLAASRIPRPVSISSFVAWAQADGLL